MLKHGVLDWLKHKVDEEQGSSECIHVLGQQWTTNGARNTCLKGL